MAKIIKCECGRKIECLHFTNTCECGADYNHAGQRLAPRSQWGEETGEHWSECLGDDYAGPGANNVGSTTVQLTFGASVTDEQKEDFIGEFRDRIHDLGGTLNIKEEHNG